MGVSIRVGTLIKVINLVCCWARRSTLKILKILLHEDAVYVTAFHKNRYSLYWSGSTVSSGWPVTIVGYHIKVESPAAVQFVWSSLKIIIFAFKVFIIRSGTYNIHVIHSYFLKIKMVCLLIGTRMKNLKLTLL